MAERFDARKASGVRLPVTVHVSEWNCTGGERADTSLEGRTVIRFELRGGVSALLVSPEKALDADTNSAWSLTMRARGTPGIRGGEVTESRFELDARAEGESGAGIRFQRKKALRVAISRGGDIPALVEEPGRDGE